MQRRVAIILLASNLEWVNQVNGLSPPHSGQVSLDGLKTILQNLQSNGAPKESILGSRLELYVDRTYIEASLVENAGRGLFAKAGCRKGDLLTCYPGDILVQSSYSDEDPFVGGEDSFVWGAHVPESNHIKEEEIPSTLSGYILQVTGDLAVLGLPTVDDEMSYVGHFANDGAQPPQRESQIASYVLESNDLANAMHISLEDCHMVTVATKNIQKGEEILVTYGPEYWMDQPFWIGDDDDDDNWPDEDEMTTSTGKGFG